MQNTIDVTGLPESVVNDLRQLVNTLRSRPDTNRTVTEHNETPEQWAARLTAWAEGHPKRTVEIDDTRETIYGGTTRPLTDEEFDRSLDEPASDATLPPLPADVPRADIYSDHD